MSKKSMGRISRNAGEKADLMRIERVTGENYPNG
jgi:hypothetical protein